jgi:hypothetical protein
VLLAASPHHIFVAARYFKIWGPIVRLCLANAGKPSSLGSGCRHSASGRSGSTTCAIAQQHTLISSRMLVMNQSYAERWFFIRTTVSAVQCLGCRPCTDRCCTLCWQLVDTSVPHSAQTQVRGQTECRPSRLPAIRLLACREKLLTMVRAAQASQPKHKQKMLKTAKWALQYVAIQVIIVLGASCAVAYGGPPPWAVVWQGGWRLALARVMAWATLVSGLAELVNADVTSTFTSNKTLAGYLTSWTVVAGAQVACVAVPSMPSLAKFIVCIVTTTVHAAVYTWLAGAREWPDKWTLAFFRTHTAVRWGVQALALLLTCRFAAAFGAPRLFGYIVATQVLWQAYCWLTSMQSGLMHTFGLYVNALLLAHVVSVWATLAAARLGTVHVAIALHALFALSSAMYEPRVSLPYQTENVNMRIWCALHCSL